LVLKTCAYGGSVPIGVGPLWDNHGFFLCGCHQTSKLESKCGTGGRRNPLRSTGTVGWLPISVACADFGLTYVYEPYALFSRGKCRRASWGSYVKLRVMEGTADIIQAIGTTSLITALEFTSAHETLAWKTPSPVTWTRWIAGMHVGSMMMLPTAVSPACRQLCRVGVCQPRQ